MGIKFADIKKPYLIAEIGINHNGDINIAKKLIDASFAANWGCVKFQKRNPDVCVPENQKDIMRETPWGKISYLEYKKKLEFGTKEYDYIDKYCKEKPIAWTASVWDRDSLMFLNEYNVPFIKIPSAKLTETELLVEAAKLGHSMIVSTGMSTLEEIDVAVDVLRKNSAEFLLMHTNSSYPCDLKDVNLGCLETLKKRYECNVGYSGHEYGLEATAYAVVLGARVIERHITLDHNMWGTDQAASIELMGMDMLYKRIKDVDLIMGDGCKKITEEEQKIKNKLRGSK